MAKPKLPDSISIVWHIDDVTDRAAERGILVSDDEAREVLRRVKAYHDCNYGVSWDTLDYHTDDVLEKTRA